MVDVTTINVIVT